MSIVVAQVETTSGTLTLWRSGTGYLLEAIHHEHRVTETIPKRQAELWTKLLKDLIV